MEREDRTPETDVYDREERCTRAIKNVARACVMRLVVAGLLVWILARSALEPWLWGLVGFVMLIDLGGMLPLAAELKKRLRELRELRAMEP